MKTNIKILLVATTLILSGCNDYLTQNPKDEIENNQEFYNSENNIRSTFIGLYDEYFKGYDTGWNRSDFFEGTNVAEWCDDLAQQKTTHFTITAPSTSSLWNFERVRRINIIITGVANSTNDEKAKAHWVGVGRFLRAMEYSQLVRSFGDVPFYDSEIKNTDYKNLFKPRDKRDFVIDKVFEDLNYASQNVRINDGVRGLVINKDVVDAYASKILLFEGTWQKYNENNNEKAKDFLTKSKDFAQKVMDGDRYHISNNYKALTNSIDLAGNPEIILYRSYVSGVLTHAEMSWQIEQTNGNSPSKDLIDSYVTKNGLPINQVGNHQFMGDKIFTEEMTNRDPRLAANIDTTSLRLNGVEGVFAISGYAGTRFINESLIGTPDGQGASNITDAPIMKFNEVLLNYIEAAAELQTVGGPQLSQKDFDISINKVRSRIGVELPKLTISGENILVDNIIINDPDRDPSVSSIIWEIRRERRVELVFEGIRFDDLRRWGKLEYADMFLNPKLNLGAWVNKPEFVKSYNEKFNSNITLENLKDIILDREGESGYILPIQNSEFFRKYNQKDYLYPLPTTQITLYEKKSEELNDKSIKLNQNPYWD